MKRLSMETPQIVAPKTGAPVTPGGSSGAKAVAVPGDVPKTPSCEEAAPATFEQLGEEDESDDIQVRADLHRRYTWLCLAQCCRICVSRSPSTSKMLCTVVEGTTPLREGGTSSWPALADMKHGDIAILHLAAQVSPSSMSLVSALLARRRPKG